MRITKFGHACVRLEHEGRVLVLDPGAFTEEDAVDGAGAVLITHEHPDHYEPGRLRRIDAPILTIAAVAAKIREEAPDVAERIVVVEPGQEFEAAGFAVTAVGELHAVIHPELPRFDNSGYLVEAGGRSLYHPGDALTEPGRPVDVLCAPVSAPWLKASEAVDFARAVGAPTSLAIHDRVYSDLGLGVIDHLMGSFLPAAGQEYRRIASGEDL